MKNNLQELPAIHTIQRDERFLNLSEKENIPVQKLTDWARSIIGHIRDQVLEGNWQENLLSEHHFDDYIFDQLRQYSEAFHQYHLRQVINATGTILHTNLGRARLSKKVMEQVVLTAGNYSNLEYDLEHGKRGSRHQLIESILTEITGAEAAMVVNNNAAAVYLILRALASGKEVVVSRGELVEIGGSFRISSIMEESGAILREIGTTNKTHLYDYEQAINEETGILMKVHTSNFKTIGFTQAVEAGELVDLTNGDNGPLVYEDLGSGALHDFPVGNEPVVSKVLETGVDIVSFSGDKLLGGPQAGIIVGKKHLVDQLKKHQLARVLRVDKMTLTALEATLKSYQEGNAEEIPTVRDMTLPLSNIKEKAARFIDEILQQNHSWNMDLKEDSSQIGGGSMPDVTIPTYVVAVSHMERTPQQTFDQLRKGKPAVLARLKHDHVLLDFRTITEEEIPQLVECFTQI